MFGATSFHYYCVAVVFFMVVSLRNKGDRGLGKEDVSVSLEAGGSQSQRGLCHYTSIYSAIMQLIPLPALEGRVYVYDELPEGEGAALYVSWERVAHEEQRAEVLLCFPALLGSVELMEWRKRQEWRAPLEHHRSTTGAPLRT
jgi:hypothetical protein